MQELLSHPLSDQLKLSIKKTAAAYIDAGIEPQLSIVKDRELIASFFGVLRGLGLE